MPLAPALICLVASSGLLWVLICGRLATPAASQAAWIRARLRSTRSMSMTAAGVPYSRAILAARDVVIKSTPVVHPVIASEAKQSMEPQSKNGLLRRFTPRNDVRKHPMVLGLFNLFA